MSGQPRSRDVDGEDGGDEGFDYDREPATGMPRWVKVGGIIVAVLALLVVIMLLVGGPGGHGPSRHMLPAGIRTQATR
jgi:hypothetical protein